MLGTESQTEVSEGRMNSGRDEASTAALGVKDVPSDVQVGIRALRHEFRTILGQILGYSELLEDQLVDLRALEDTLYRFSPPFLPLKIVSGL